ncbi:MAG: OmpA family protein [Spirochaetes bacterium]|nr:OmpA family protein [Spirochaetota bacterium]
MEKINSQAKGGRLNILHTIKDGNWRFVFLFLLFAISSNTLYGDVFEYRHRAGSRYRIISVVTQNVYINRILSHSAEILNRIAVEVVDENNGEALHRALVQTSERSTAIDVASRSFEWAREYETVFTRDRLGFMSIAPEYFMPVVRNVPVFPDRPLSVGDTWSAEGHEMHDFRDSFGFEEPFRIPFTAHYEYLGTRQWRGRDYSAFSVSYRIYYRPAGVRGRDGVSPQRILGGADQIVFWDHALGRAAAYEGEFRMVFALSDGATVEFRGQSHGEVYDAQEMDRDRIAEEIAAELERQNIGNVEIRVVDEGVVIVMEDIIFQPDSAIMLPGEDEKLDIISAILLQHSDRDILVSGHTALAGTPEARMQLSVERARTVADFLISRNVRSEERVVIRGYGAQRPVADNFTEEGMRRNRRVEITILEN